MGRRVLTLEFSVANTDNQEDRMILGLCHHIMTLLKRAFYRALRRQFLLL